MTLKLHKIAPDLEKLSAYSLEQAKSVESHLTAIETDLQKAPDPAALEHLVRQAAESGWDGAIPMNDEPIDFRTAAPDAAESLSVVAVDGSQVYPDRHAAALYYVINIGHFIHRAATGETEADSLPHLAYGDEAVFQRGGPISQTVLNARRTTQEMLRLQALACSEQNKLQLPVLALMDGTIALRIQEESFPQVERKSLQPQYFAALQALAAARIPFAGYVARPGGNPVLSLTALAASGLVRPGERWNADSARPYGGIPDRAYFSRKLAAGERSAVFAFQTYWNSEYTHAPGNSSEQGVCFFYVNVGRLFPVIARVETPAICASRPENVERMHAEIIRQCRITLNDPYPYALIRADEEAFISSEEKSFLERRMAAEFIRNGLPAVRSEKLQHKGRARRKTR